MKFKETKSFLKRRLAYLFLLRKGIKGPFFAMKGLYSPISHHYAINSEKMPDHHFTVNRIALMFASFLGRIIDASRSKGDCERYHSYNEDNRSLYSYSIFYNKDNLTVQQCIRQDYPFFDLFII
ncbi:hypothetical protein [Flammeovirga sp. SJP92]|uniref:hypothetical protein n=1 Tax=Flammeovirga sp. SJP92 TaxID=1775430 RepID=UPI0007873050|nr:hypothetical protein [Flammeovirga sp. SJP92]KXX71989.1 hypothetical protein AVL50_04185 [Flammeovirga sp. SJP92]